MLSQCTRTDRRFKMREEGKVANKLKHLKDIFWTSSPPFVRWEFKSWLEWLGP